MIDERHEELAALYALDLLEGAEKTAFEAALARDAALQALVNELRESSAVLAHTAPAATPPPELKARLLAEIGARAKPAAENKVIAFPSRIPWAAAACFALLAAWSGQRYLSSRSEASALRDQQALAEITFKNLQNQLEAERIIARQQVADLNRQVADTTRQVAEARQATTDADRLLAASAQRVAAANQKLDDFSRQMADLNHRIDIAGRVAGEAARRESELDRLLASAKGQIATLEERIKTEGDLANLKIAKLASMLKNSPQALAVAVWNPAKQEGIFIGEKLPPATADQDYELWVIDPQQPTPVSAGVFPVGSDGVARLQFKTEAPVAAVAKFAVSREKKGGAPAHGGPKGDVVLISQ